METNKTHQYQEEFTLKAGLAISGFSTASKGTLGAIVYKDGTQMILTNAHVVGEEDHKEAEKNRELLLVRIKERGWQLPEALIERIEKGETPVFHPPYYGGQKEAKLVAFVTEVTMELDHAIC